LAHVDLRFKKTFNIRRAGIGILLDIHNLFNTDKATGRIFSDRSDELRDRIMIQNKKISWVFAALLILFFCAFVLPEKRDTGLLSDKTVEAICEEISGERTLDTIYGIIPYNRNTGSREYDQAAQYLLTKLKNSLIPEVVIEEFAREWKDGYYLRKEPPWLAVQGWSVKKGVLKTINPERKIADFEEEPVTLARMSRSFKGRAEIIYVGDGTSENDYSGVDVEGKIVLARGYAETVHDLAVLQRGAVGVICYGPSSYNALKGQAHPNMVVWQVLSPVENKVKKPQFAFSISAEKGGYLLGLLKDQKRVEVEVDIETEFYDNNLKIVNALIPGKDLNQEEFIFYAHLDHFKPSAGDNASGCATLVEIARTLQSLVQRGKIAPPKRSIRFVWGPEGPGSLMYVNSRMDKMRSTLAGLNLDMVGEDMEKTHSVMRITRPPDSLPSFLGDLVHNMIENLDTKFVKAPTGKRNFLNYRFMPFSANSDHFIFNDGAVSVPMLMFIYWPDEFHHTNLDTPDKLDTTELKRTACLAASTAYFIASASDQDAYDLAQVVCSNGIGRIAQSVQKGLSLLRACEDRDLMENFKAGRDYIKFAAKRERGAIISCERLCRDEELKKEMRLLTSAINKAEDLTQTTFGNSYLEQCRARKIKPQKVILNDEEREASLIVPRRKGPYFNSLWSEEIPEEMLNKEEKDFLKDFEQRFVDFYIRIPEILNFADGRNSILEIRDAVASEYFGFMTASDYVGHPEDIGKGYRTLEIEDVRRLMDIFKKYGLVTF